MSRCARCGCKLDARNRRGYCRDCFNALPTAQRMTHAQVFEVVATAPQVLIVAVLERQGYTVTPPGGVEV